MRTASETVDVAAPAADVFAYVDDIRAVGGHMTDRPSLAMLGSRLTLEILSVQPTGVGATYRYSGRVLGVPLQVSEVVTQYGPGREKVWRTNGSPRLLILASYEMCLLVAPRSPTSSRLTVSMVYDLPRSWPGWILGCLLAGWYSRWCLRRICADVRQALQGRPAS